MSVSLCAHKHTVVVVVITYINDVDASEQERSAEERACTTRFILFSLSFLAGYVSTALLIRVIG